MVKRCVGDTVYPTIDRNILVESIVNMTEEVADKFGEWLIKENKEKICFDSISDKDAYEVASFLNKYHAIKLDRPLSFPLKVVEYW